MSNPYYNPSGVPLALTRGTSSQIRAEFASIGEAFDTLAVSSLSAQRVPRTSNTILATGDRSKLIDITSGTFSQTVSASSSLTAGWYCYIKNSSDSDTVTITPNGSETVDGLTSIKVYPGESFILQSDGANLYTIGRSRIVFLKDVAFTGVASVTISGPFSDAEVTGMDVTTNLVVTGASVSPTLTIGGWSNLVGGEVSQATTTLAGVAVGAASLTLDSALSSAQILTSEFQLRSIKNATGLNPTIFIRSTRSNSRQSFHAIKNNGSVVPTSLVVTATGGTASGNYSMTLYRGKNV